MASPNDFILSSDYDSLKNDDSVSGVTLTVPDHVFFGPGATTYSKEVAVGQAESLLNVKATNNLSGPYQSYTDNGSIQSGAGGWYLATVQLRYDRVAVAGSAQYPYSVYAHATHSSGNKVRFDVTVYNPYTNSVYLSTKDIYTFSLRTYIAPQF